MVWLMVILLVPPDVQLEAWRHLPKITLEKMDIWADLHRHVEPIRRVPEEPQWVEGQVVVGYEASKAGAVQQAVEARGYRVKETNTTLRFMLLEVPQGKTTLQAVKELEKLPGVTYAEPNYLYHALEFRRLWSANRKDLDAPADALLDLQYNLKLIKADKAWLLTKGRPSVKVAVLDTGLSYRNAPIPTAEQHGGSVVGNYVAALEGPAYLKIISGADLVHGDNFPDAEHPHGTHVATIIAQKGHEAVYTVQNGNLAGGTVGIAPNVTIMPIKVLDWDGTGSMTTIATAIQIAADSGADIINLSLGGPGSTTLENAVNYAWNKGALIVAACGNSSAPNCDYPARYARAMGVSSVDFGLNLASYSSYGDVAIAAPGGDNEDLNNDGEIDAIWNIAFKDSVNNLGVQVRNWPESLMVAGYMGTSMATPTVAAVAALVKSIDTTLTNQDLWDILTTTAQNLGNPSRFGAGLVNAWAACSLAAANRGRPLPLIDSIYAERTSTPYGVVWDRGATRDTFWVLLPPQNSADPYDYFSFWIRLKNYGSAGSVRARLLYASAASGAWVDPTYGEADFGTLSHLGTGEGYFRIHVDDTVSLNRIFWFALAFSYDNGTTWPDTLGYFFLPVGAPPVWLVYDDYTGMPININGTLYGIRSHPEFYEGAFAHFKTSRGDGIHYLPWYPGIMGYPPAGSAGIMSLTSLTFPEAVVWWMGADWVNGFSAFAGDTAALQAFLSAGGDLFFSGQDYIWADYSTNTNVTFTAGQFIRYALGITSATQDVHTDQNFTATGVDAGPPKTNDLTMAIVTRGTGGDSGWAITYDDRITGAATGWTWSFQYQANRRNAIRGSFTLAKATSPSKRWVGLFPVENQNVGDPEGDSLMFRFFRWSDIPQFVNLYASNPLAVAEDPALARRIRLVYGPRPEILLMPAPQATYRLSLFDPLGRQVWVLEVRPPYEGTVRLAPPPRPSGIYFLRVQENSKVLGIQRILLR